MMKIGSRGRESRRGTALVLVVIILGSLMFLSAALMMVTGTESKRIEASLDDVQAFYLAEAGLSEAFTALSAGATGDIGSAAVPVALGDGVFWVDTTTLVTGQRRLLVTAMAGSGRAAIDVLLKGDAAPVFAYTLNSRDTLTINEGVMTDSYDSTLGSHVSQVVNTFETFNYASPGGDVASNKNIELNARAHVFGDAVPGPGYGVSFATDAYVSGATTPAPEPFTFPPITIPSIPSSGAFGVPSNAVAALPAGKYDFTTFEIGTNATLTIDGPAVIVVDDFATYKDANLLINAINGPVTFYVEGTYTHGKNFEADSVPGSPVALAFFIEGTQNIVFPSASKIRGGYYAPNANILFTNYNEVWGSIAANRIEMASSMSFHYDEALSKYWDDDTGGNSGSPVIAWMPTAVTPSSLRTDRRDPCVVLGIGPGTPTNPTAGWVW